MMWELKVNTISNEGDRVKLIVSRKNLVQGGHNYGNSQAGVFNLFPNDLKFEVDT
jgi:hypothetical protein